MYIVFVILQSFLLVSMTFGGASKLAGSKNFVEMFDSLKLPQWFRVVTGIVQLAGAAGLVIGYWYMEVAAMGRHLDRHHHAGGIPFTFQSQASRRASRTGFGDYFNCGCFGSRASLTLFYKLTNWGIKRDKEKCKWRISLILLMYLRLV